MERPQKEKPAIKAKAIHEKKNRKSCQSLSVAPTGAVLTELYVKRLIFFPKS